jgi:hypothetical protein
MAEAWLWYGHTVGKESPGERITPGAGFTAWILGPHLSLGHDGCVFEFGDRTIYYHSVLPIYPEELDFARICGADALFWFFSYARIDDLIHIERPNVAM